MFVGVCFSFYGIGILETFNRQVVIEKPEANETSIPSEQLLPVQEVGKKCGIFLN